MEFVKEIRDGLYSDHPQEDQEEEVVMEDNNNNSTASKQLFSSSSSSSFSSLSPSSSSSQYKNVVVHHSQQQQQQIHQLPANFLSGISNSSATEVIGEFIEKEHMFDKVVTPSDVGKLNRLVIPKQHAEKYFPLDSAANEKGLLLNFEDRSGKPWRFRYSYWNSSQSYVMTKGWSRFVKEKKLDAGDIVSFERGAAESYKDRFYIDWRRRPQAPDLSLHHHSHPLSFPRTVIPWGTTHARLFYPQNLAVSSSARDHLQLNYDHHHHQQQQQQQHYHYHQQQQLQQRLSSSTSSTSYGNYSNTNMVNNNQRPGSVVYLRSSSSPITTRISDHQPHHQQQQVGLMQQYTSGDNHNNMAMVFDSVPVVHGQAAAKRVRLFGVNLECPISEDDNECDILSSTTIPMNTAIGGSSIHAHHPHHQILNNPSHLIHSAPPPHLQLRVYNGAPLPTMPTELPKRGRPSLSFDLDI